jgi:hypothetical protein
MSRRTGREPLPFRQALEAEAERRRALPLEFAKSFTYIDRGYYTAQLERLWRYFPREQTIVFKSEDLLGAHAEVLARVADFLGIAPFPPLAQKTAEVREYNVAMGAEEKRYLAGLYETEIGALERLLGWDCSAWRA